MELLYLDKIDSTNKYAKEYINEISDKTVVYTFNQTAGRGRMERKWNNTGSENIYASIVLKPSSEMKDIYSNLTQYLALVLAETFEEYNVIPKIKWPNDIRINKKKISGILAEVVMEKSTLKGLVIGVGINLNCKKEDIENINQAATSLNLEIQKKVDKNIFLQRLLEKFCLGYDRFINKGFLSIRDEYIKRAEFIGKEIKVRVFDKDINGIAINITDSGALKIKKENNEEQILYIGDIL